MSPRLNDAARAVLATITGFAMAYNRDDSDSSSDYFSTNFYDGRATFATDLEHGERKVAQFAADRAAQWFALACSGVAA